MGNPESLTVGLSWTMLIMYHVPQGLGFEVETAKF